MRITGFLLPAVLTLSLAAAASDKTPAANDADKPRVFITDSQSWEIMSNSGGGNGAYASHTGGGARPQTAEIIKTFGERCSQVVTNNKQDKADYIVVLDHEGGKSFVRHKNKVAVFNRVSGDSVISKSTVSLGGSVQTACEAIVGDWATHGKDIRAAEAADAAPAAAATPAPQVVPVAAAAVVADPPKPSTAKLAIASNPSGADIEVDGSFVGNTPSEIEVAAGEHAITVSKNGYKPWQKKLKALGGSVNLNAELEAEAK
jgi:hypothetical protein